MDFAVIVPTRGDRPKFFAFCKEQLDRQTLQPKARYYIAYDPIGKDMDLVRRIKSGIELAKKDGIDCVVIIEDDDAIRKDHLEIYAREFGKSDFIGDNKSYYYNIKTLRWSLFRHTGRSSLFTTAFRVSSVEDFKWPADNTKFLDIALWDHAKKKRKAFVNSGAIGIKHGVGLVGGKGHVMKLKNADPEMRWLKSRIEDYQFSFYKDLRLTI